jgi:hypothetical protein
MRTRSGPARPLRRAGPLSLSLALALAGAALPARAQDPAPPDTAAAPVPAPPPPAAGRGIRVCAGGDVTLGTNLDTAWVHTARARLGRRVAALPPPDSLLAPLRPLLADADVVLWNVESAIGEGPVNRRKCAPGSTACFAFRSPVASAGALRRVSPESASVIATLANNHARDDGDIGRRISIGHLRAAGVEVTGIDTLPTLVVTASGDTVAFLGFAQWTGPDPRDLAAVRRHVRRAATRARRVVVTMHMGAEGRGAQRTPDAAEQFHGENRGNVVAFARAAAGAGADLVVGHGPHVMRAAEWRGETLVFYSLGNLVTYGPFGLGEPMNRGALACAVLDGDGRVEEAALRSTVQAYPGIVAPDPSARAAALADSLGALDFPHSAARVDAATGAVLRPGERPRGPVPAAVPSRPR